MVSPGRWTRRRVVRRVRASWTVETEVEQTHVQIADALWGGSGRERWGVSGTGYRPRSEPPAHAVTLGYEAESSGGSSPMPWAGKGPLKRTGWRGEGSGMIRE